MALKATIFKAELQVSDLDRHYYQEHQLTIARHPSETDERMMVRVLAFALNADARLTFGRGLSSEDEADLCTTDLTGALDHWIDVGLPDERRVLKAASRANRVSIYAYGSAVPVWWKPLEGKLARNDKISVYAFEPDATQALAAWAQRTMRLQCTIQDRHVWLGDEAGRSLEIVARPLLGLT